MDHTQNPLADQVPLARFPVLEADTAEQFLRSRRSIRTYKDQKVPQLTLLRLLDIAHFAPTGGNTQGVSYRVISDGTVLGEITAAVIGWLEEQVRQEVAWIKPYAGLAKVYRQTGKDIILRGGAASGAGAGVGGESYGTG